MSKGILSFFTIALFYLSAVSQYKTLLVEEFKNNKAGWPVQHDSSFLVDIRKGVLHLEKFNTNHNDRGCLWYHKEIEGFNTLHNFSVTIYAKFIGGGDIMDVFDLQWGQWNKVINHTATSLYQLNLFLKGGVRLEYFHQQWDYSLREQAREVLNRSLYQPNMYNKYELIQKDEFIILNVNDHQYFKQFVNPIAEMPLVFKIVLSPPGRLIKLLSSRLGKIIVYRKRMDSHCG